MVLIGFLVGISIGLTGVGGGSLMTPALLFMGIPPTTAIGTDLIFAAVTKLAGSIQHLRQRNVRPRWALYLAAGSLPGSVLGVSLIVLLRAESGDANHFVRVALGAVLIVSAAAAFAKELVVASPALSFPRRGAGGLFNLDNADGRVGVPQPEPRFWPVAGIGAGVGVLVGLTSMGSGSLIALVLMILTPLEMRQIVGTDIAHAALLALAAGLIHFELGSVNLSLVGSLVLGSVPGVLIGSRLTCVLPGRPLKLGIACLLLISGLRLI